MTLSKVVSKRNRPALGTFVEVTLESEGDFATTDIFADTFSELARLENKFNFFSDESLVSKINQAAVGASVVIDEEMLDLIQFSLHLRDISSGAFTPVVGEQSLGKLNPQLFFKLSSVDGRKSVTKIFDGELNFSGVAKGFIVDRLTERIQQNFPTISGSINAGGDIRSFGEKSVKPVTVRVGSADQGLARQLMTERAAVATSCPDFAQDFLGTIAKSKTVYAFSPSGSVTVISDSCKVADAMTKVALFASAEILKRCSEILKCEVLRFDREGNLA